ncbi:MAG: sugar phosphate isomerase/epimerase [Verrucomicrobia bacterium]|nr:sugar phosphate isomerase/epimerase [Verrucomicrobiota bacterium]
MKLGLSTYAYAWAIGVPGHPPARPMDLFGLLAEAERLGTRVLQVCDNLPLTGLTSAELDEFERRAGASGIAVEVGTRGLQPDNVLTHLRLAQRFHSPFVRIVTDSAGDEPSPEEVVARLRVFVPEFQRAGVRLALENHDRFTARTLAWIIERIGTNHAGICLDTVNSFGALEGPEVVVETLAPYTLNLHVKDFTIERVSSKMGFILTGCPAGEGRLNLPWLLERLGTAGREVNAILELWPPFGPTLDDTIARERAWAEASVRNLRKLIPG